MLHRLRVDQRSAPDLEQIRVTLLSRETRYRKIINEDALLGALRNNSNLVVRRVCQKYFCHDDLIFIFEGQRQN